MAATRRRRAHLNRTVNGRKDRVEIRNLSAAHRLFGELIFDDFGRDPASRLVV